MFGEIALLAAIFGLSYLGVKGAKENWYKSEANMLIEHHKEQKEKWVKKVSNWELEKEFISKLSDCLNPPPEIIRELSDSWEYYYSYKPPEKIFISTIFEYERTLANGYPPIPPMTCSVFISRKDALRFLMANRGFMLQEDAEYGIPYVDRKECDKKKINAASSAEIIGRIVRKVGQRLDEYIPLFTKINGGAEYRGYLVHGHPELVTEAVWNDIIPSWRWGNIDVFYKEGK